MGRELEKIFDVVEEKAGNNGRMRLAKITGISKAKALEIPDDADSISLIKRAASEIIGKNIDEYLGSK